MITRIEIENFKGVGARVGVDLKPLTLLFGANSAGKSTILHALHYAYTVLTEHQAEVDKVRRGGEAFDLGGFTTMVHRHEFGRAIAIRLAFTFDRALVPGLGDVARTAHPPRTQAEALGRLVGHAATAWLEVRVALHPDRRQAVPLALLVGLDDAEVASLHATPDGHALLVLPRSAAWPEPWNGEAAFHEPLEDAARLIPNFDVLLWRPLPELSPAAAAADPMALVGGAARRLLGAIGGQAVQHLATMLHVGPLRAVPARDFRPLRGRLEAGRWIDGLGAWDALYQESFQDLGELNRWMAALGLGYHLERLDVTSVTGLGEAPAAAPVDLLRNIGLRSQVVLVHDPTGVRVAPYDLGMGISQLFPVVAAALVSEAEDEARLVAIEQPELHVHPRLQVGLADLFIEAIAWSAPAAPGAPTAPLEGASFLVETHSEHLMLRLLRRIRETDEQRLGPGARPLVPDQLAVLYVEPGADGAMTVTPLRVDVTGEFLDRWPDGFFEERAGELFS